MEQRKFTPEDQRALEANPYVARVSETTITYTEEFKERFALEYAAGKAPSIILREHGFDTAVLGRDRKDSLVKRIKAYSQRPSGFRDTRKGGAGRPRIKDLTDAEKIQRLEHQVKYLKQENEFLKKIRYLDRQAEWECKRKQNRKKSIKSSKK
ncbi:MAG: transposase [Firmicutes bacterium]|nr:transposase [Bacillota bacterium]